MGTDDFFTDSLASLDTSVSPVDLLAAFSPSSSDSGMDDYSWTESSSGNSSPCSDSDYFPCSGVIKKEDSKSTIKDIKPRSSISKPKTKKNQRNEATFDGNSSLFFTRSELLKMSCEELEKRVSAVERVRSLTEKEKKEIKRQRRMIKNRESAYASRVRKKQLVENMEEAMAKIQEENRMLKLRVFELERENQELKANVRSPWSIGDTRKIVSQTSTSLFIVLLSFGLLFAQMQPDINSANSFPSFSSAFPSFEAQQILGSGHVISSSANSGGKSFSHSNSPGVKNRVLLMHDHDDMPQMQPQAQQMKAQHHSLAQDQLPVQNEMLDHFLPFSQSLPVDVPLDSGATINSAQNQTLSSSPNLTNSPCDLDVRVSA